MYIVFARVMPNQCKATNDYTAYECIAMLHFLLYSFLSLYKSYILIVLISARPLLY
jgi:hypothetical protein